jgi:hypothetical protein
MKACFNELYTHLHFSKTNERLQRSKELLYRFKFKITDLVHEVSDFCMPRVRNENRAPARHTYAVAVENGD